MTETQSTAVRQIQPFNMMDAMAFFDSPAEPDDYIVEGLLPSGCLSILAGKPKVGKSCVVRQLAVAVSQGKTFLGRDTTQGTVLYFGIEEHLNGALEHFRLLGMKGSDPIHVLFNAVNKPDAIAMLIATLKNIRDVKLVIIDPLFKFLPIKDASDYTEVSSKMEPLQMVAREHHVHIVGVHHMKKAATEDTMDGILGSIAIFGGADTAIALGKNVKGVREICTVQRYGENIEPTQLGWNPETRSMSIGLTTEEVTQEERQWTLEQIDREIIKYVHDNPACQQSAIINAVHGRTSDRKRRLQFLIDQKNVFNITGAGVKGDPYLYTLCEVPRTEGSIASEVA